jgi:hypothetical protein
MGISGLSRRLLILDLTYLELRSSSHLTTWVRFWVPGYLVPTLSPTPRILDFDNQRRGFIPNLLIRFSSFSSRSDALHQATTRDGIPIGSSQGNVIESSSRFQTSFVDNFLGAASETCSSCIHI